MSAVCVRLRGLRHDRWQVAPVKIPFRRVPHFPSRRGTATHPATHLLGRRHRSRRLPLRCHPATPCRILLYHGVQNIFIPIAYLSRHSVLNDGRLRPPPTLYYIRLLLYNTHTHSCTIYILYTATTPTRLPRLANSYYIVSSLVRGYVPIVLLPTIAFCQKKNTQLLL